MLCLSVVYGLGAGSGKDIFIHAQNVFLCGKVFKNVLAVGIH